MVREAEQSDLDAILELYLFLHEDSIPEKDEHLRDTWLQIIQDPVRIIGERAMPVSAWNLLGR